MINESQLVLGHASNVLRISLNAAQNESTREMTRRAIQMIESMTQVVEPAPLLSRGDDLTALAALLPKMKSPPQENRGSKNATG